MRLLPKKEIDSQKAQERKAEIDEGVKLARRVDSLRELQATEEANLTKFRQASLAQLQMEIKPLEEQRDGLLREVTSLEERRAIALIPLDAEWQKLDREKALCTEKEEELREREIFLEQNIHEAELSFKEAETEKGRAKDLRRIASEELAKAEELRKQATKESEDMREEARLLLDTAKLRDKESLKKLAEAIVKEKEVDMRYKSFFVWEKQLIDRERLLRDREQLLKENLQRYGHDL